MRRDAAGPVAGIVLAAGRSRRLASPTPKQLLPFAGEPLVRRAARAALGSRLDQVVVVIGHRAAEVRDAVADLPLQVVENPAFREGKSTSIRTGLEALDREPEAALFLPCDQPFVGPELIDRLLAAWRHGGDVVQPVCGARRGAPVLWGKRHFAALKALRGDDGGRVLLDAWRRSREVEVCEVEARDEHELLDIDTLDDWVRARDAACRKGR